MGSTPLWGNETHLFERGPTKKTSLIEDKQKRTPLYRRNKKDLPYRGQTKKNSIMKHIFLKEDPQIRPPLYIYSYIYLSIYTYKKQDATIHCRSLSLYILIYIYVYIYSTCRVCPCCVCWKGAWWLCQSFNRDSSLKKIKEFPYTYTYVCTYMDIHMHICLSIYIHIQPVECVPAVYLEKRDSGSVNSAFCLFVARVRCGVWWDIWWLHVCTYIHTHTCIMTCYIRCYVL